MTNSNLIYLSTIIILFTSLFTACNPNKAAEFNDNLVLYKEMADNDFTIMNKYINIALSEKEYSTIDFVTTSCIDSLSLRIEIINKLNTPPSGESLKKSIVSYIQSLSYVSEAYRSYTILADSIVSKEQIDSIGDIIEKAEGKIDSTLNLVLSTQKEFAKTKRLRLE